MTEHVVVGAGQIGTTVAEQLAQAGEEVRVVTRSGSGPRHDLVERVAADAGDRDAVAALLAGARVVHHCLHTTYTEKAWRRDLPPAEAAVLAAAGAAGALVVFPESLYSYTRSDAPMTEDGPRDARGGKRGVRTELLAARAASPTPTVSVVASDVFGPHATANAHAGERMLTAVLGGKRLLVLGSPDQSHTFTYLPDLARAMIAAADRADLRRGGDAVLHAPSGPAFTQRQMAQAYADVVGTTARVGAIPGWLLSLGALVPGPLREMDEMRYQFTAPFVMDSAASQRTLGLEPTPLAEAAAATVAWWRERTGAAAARSAA